MAGYTETIIIAIGGSLLVPDAIDTSFVQRFSSMVGHLLEEGYQLIIVPGGGKTARNYQAALRALCVEDTTALDDVGIKSIHVNCNFLQHVFRLQGLDSKLIYKPEEVSAYKEASLIVKAAYQVGSSSDMGAVRMAEILGAQKIINFSNTSHVYSDDPRLVKDAKRYTALSWKEYQSFIPTEWTPGMSAPFDPIASQKAADKGIHVAVLGASVENLSAYLHNRDFEGTVIS